MQHSPLEEQIKVVKTKLEQAKRLGDAKVIMEQTTKLIELLKKKQTEKSII
jgi:DNA primase